jgi:hypothetical protein
VAVFDATTGQLLWQVNGNKRCYPASTTKILTGLLFAEATPADAIVRCTNKQIASVGESSLNIKFNESEDVITELEHDCVLIMWNDDYNTFDWVINTLIEICGHHEEQAEQKEQVFSPLFF